MGAYENPPIITPPNYGEIFMKNFIAMFDYTRKLKAEKAADPGKANRIKEAKAAMQDYRKESKAVRKGATGVELTKVIDNGRTFINDISNQYIAGGISWEDYNNGINKADGLLNTLNTLKDRFALEGQALEELEKAGISNYQTSPVGGLITAFKNNQVIPEVNEDYELTGLTYTIYDKENNPITQTIPIDALSDKRFFSVNESYATEYAGLKESLEKIYAGKEKLDASFEKTTKTDTGSVTKKYRGWKNNYDPAIAIENSTELKVVFNSDENAGSIYEDILTLNWDDDDYIALADELIKENKLTGNNAEILREIIESKQYRNIDSSGDELEGKVSAKSIINNWSKKQIAQEIANKANSEYLFKGVVTKETIDEKEKGIPEKEILAKGGWIYNPPKTSESLQEIYGNKNIKYGTKTIIEIRPSSGYNINGKFPVDIYLGNEGEDVKANAVPETIDLGNQKVQEKLLNNNNSLFTKELTSEIYSRILGLDELPD